MGNSGSFTSKTASARLGYGVGERAFLSSKASKVAAYYRGLEYGSTKFVGRTIYGVFGPGFRYASGGLPFSQASAEFAGGRGKQQFFPLRYAASIVPNSGKTPSRKLLNHLRAAAYSGADTSKSINSRHATKISNKARGSVGPGSLEVKIEHPIIAQDAYRRAFASFKPGLREEQAVLQVMGKLGFTSGGFRNGRNGSVTGGQTFTRFIDQRTRGKAPITAAGIRKRFGVITGGATSGYTGSLVNVDRTFQAELIRINRLLAEALAVEVAKIQKESIKRPATSTGQLVDTTLDPRNRFPR